MNVWSKLPMFMRAVLMAYQSVPVSGILLDNDQIVWYVTFGEVSEVAS